MSVLSAHTKYYTVESSYNLGHLAVLQLVVSLDAASAAGRVDQLIVAEVPDLVLLERQVVVGAGWNPAGGGGRRR